MVVGLVERWVVDGTALKNVTVVSLFSLVVAVAVVVLVVAVQWREMFS